MPKDVSRRDRWRPAVDRQKDERRNSRPWSSTSGKSTRPTGSWPASIRLNGRGLKPGGERTFAPLRKPPPRRTPLPLERSSHGLEHAATRTAELAEYI